MAEVQSIVCGEVEEGLKPSESLEIPVQQLVEKVDGPILPQQLVQPYTQISPQQLVEWNDEYVQQIMAQLQQQGFASAASLQGNVYTTQPNPINVEAEESVPINPDMFGFQKATDVLDGRKVLSIEELQRRIDAESQTAATEEEKDAVKAMEIYTDLINSYNVLDTYNKAMVGLFVQIILKNENSVS